MQIVESYPVAVLIWILTILCCARGPTRKNSPARNGASRVKTAFFCLLILFSFAAAGLADNSAKIPVIMNTDIGDDMDDTWSLGLLLKSPELDLKLVVGDQERPEYRAKLLAKFWSEPPKNGLVFVAFP